VPFVVILNTIFFCLFNYALQIKRRISNPFCSACGQWCQSIWWPLVGVC